MKTNNNYEFYLQLMLMIGENYTPDARLTICSYGDIEYELEMYETIAKLNRVDTKKGTRLLIQAFPFKESFVILKDKDGNDCNKWDLSYFFGMVKDICVAMNNDADKTAKGEYND